MRKHFRPSFQTETGDFADIVVAAANGALFSAFTDAPSATKTVDGVMMQRQFMALLVHAKKSCDANYKKARFFSMSV